MRARMNRREGAGFAGISAGIVIAASAIFALAANGSPTVLLVACGAAVATVAMAIWRPRPIVATLCALALLAPFDTLLNVTPNGTITKYIGLLAVLVAIAEIVTRKSIVKPHAAILAWVAYLSWATASMLWAIDLSESGAFLITVGELFALYAIVSVLPFQWDEVKQIMVAAITGGCMISAYSYYLAGHAAVAGSAIRIFQGENRTFLRLPGGSETSDPNHVAASLLLPIGLAAAFAVGADSRLQRLLAAGALLILSVGVYENNSRGTVVALALMVVYLILRSAKRWVFAFPAAAIFLAVVTTPNAIIGRFLHDPGQGSGRGSIWGVAWLAFRDHWFTGVGIANFGSVFDETFLRTRELVFEGWHRPAHSIAFSTAVELGIVGLILLSIVAVQQFGVLREVPRRARGFDARTTLEATLLAIGTAALFVDLMHFKYVWVLFIVVGITRSAAINDMVAVHVPASLASLLHPWSKRRFASVE